MNMNSDPYADLSHLCGIAAFSLPPRPLLLSLPPPPCPPEEHFGPIPHHLLPRYLCYDAPSPELPSSSIPYSPPATTTHPSPEPLLLHSPPLCPDFTPHDSPLPSPDITASLANVASSPQLSPPPSFNYSDSVTAAAPPHSETLLHETLISCNRDSPRHMDSPVQQREILPPCVVNYQDTLCFTPERETCYLSASLGVGVSDDENRVPGLLPTTEINEMSLCDSNYDLAQYLVSVMKDSAVAGGYGKRLPSLVKKLALWRKDVTLDGKECEKIASFVKFSFSSRGRENILQEPSRKKQRKQEAKSKGVASSFYFTRSKSASRLS
ncbi:uncharacterized protein [Primulina eburnea]|uniref:uncharacterized protein n=1 Tax=Primulina eburnea TaxID=1245227 RepID=UPI003C6C3D09